jgi:hypothetical protein
MWYAKRESGANMRALLVFLCFCLYAVFVVRPEAARAQENITYTYDALGRVVTETHVGGDNDGMVVTYSYDAAGNRTHYAVAGANNAFPFGAKVIVVPLNGFTIIPVPNTGGGQ